MHVFPAVLNLRKTMLISIYQKVSGTKFCIFDHVSWWYLTCSYRYWSIKGNYKVFL